MKVVAFVPIKYNSERLKHKNFLPLNGKPLCYHIFNTLKQISSIDDIYVYCSNKDILQILPDNIKFLLRDKELDSDKTLGIELYQDFCNRVESDIYILCHATSPFIKSNSINIGLDNVLNNSIYDSSFSAKKEQNFAWYKNKPINYNTSYIPKTQNLEPIYIETSAFYIFNKNIINSGKRIGNNPYLVITDLCESVDIDYFDDYLLAQAFSNIIKPSAVDI